MFLTHMHADFIAGHLELRDRVGATIYLGARASADYAFTQMADGDEVRLGDVRLSVLETPGHSPESISILVFDPERSDESPYAVLAGDTLVYPAHGAGSSCGKNLSTDTVSTIGVQREFNDALQPMSRELFIEIVTTDQPDTPAYFTYDAVLSSQERLTPPVAIAESLLRREGLQVTNLVGGLAAWAAAQLPTQRSTPRGSDQDAHCRSWISGSLPDAALARGADDRRMNTLLSSTTSEPPRFSHWVMLAIAAANCHPFMCVWLPPRGRCSL